MTATITKPWQESGNALGTDAQKRMLNAICGDLSYDAITGNFTWLRDGRGQTKRAGGIAGTPHSNGYIRIKTGGVTYLAHRLAWMFTYGRWPDSQIDHVNGDRADNRIGNLREASLQQNRWNTAGFPSRRKHSKFKGVTREKGGGKWVAKIYQSGASVRIGSFDSEILASDAYQAAAKRLRGEFAK